MTDYRHVCFKDLNHYFKRDDYFSDLTSKEKKLIKKNLGIADTEKEDNGFVVKGTYSEIKNLADSGKLNINSVYIITDYRTIYKSNIGEVWGDAINPSKVYSIVLTPISEYEFGKDVIMMYKDKVLNWEVRYDFSEEDLGTQKTRGKILYLKDQNNNSAYYDFKNIRTRVKIKSTDISGIMVESELDLYTFNEATRTPTIFVENSDDSHTVNNCFEQDCYSNVFLGITHNNTFAGGFKNNLFLTNCQFNKFGYNTHNNKFEDVVMYCSGSIRNKNIKELDNTIEKEFVAVGNDFAIKYLDNDTLTYQIEKL